MKPKHPLVEDFPLIPKPVDVSPVTKEIVKELVDRIADSEEESTDLETDLLGAVLLLTLELGAQLDWRSRLIHWMHELDEWLSDSPNIIRKDRSHG